MRKAFSLLLAGFCCFSLLAPSFASAKEKKFEFEGKCKKCKKKCGSLSA